MEFAALEVLRTDYPGIHKKIFQTLVSKVSQVAAPKYPTCPHHCRSQCLQHLQLHKHKPFHQDFPHHQESIGYRIRPYLQSRLHHLLKPLQ